LATLEVGIEVLEVPRFHGLVDELALLFGEVHNGAVLLSDALD